MNRSVLVLMLLISLAGTGLAQIAGEGPIQETAADKPARQKQAQAKTQVDAARAQAGCGPAEVEFDVKTDKNQHPVAQPEEGKAVVYVFEEEKKQPNQFNIGSVTARIGLDGQWVGANHGKSYFFFTVDPGEHHLCAQWQSSLQRFSRLGSALTFSAAAGKTYYFRAEVEERNEFPAAVQLKPVDDAEGQFLISSGALSTSHAKKTPEQQADSQ